MDETPVTPRPQAPRSLFHAVGLTFAGRGIEVGLAALANILIARMLGPSGRGNLTTALTAAFILYLLCELGVRAAVTRLVAAGRMTWRDGVATLMLLYAAACAIVLPPCIFAIIHYHAQLFPGVSLPVLFLALGSVPMIMLEGSIAAVLAGQQRIPEVNALRVLERGAVIISLVLLVWAVHTGLLGAMIASVIGLGVGTVLGLILLRRVPGERGRVRYDLIPEIFRFGLVLHIGNLAMSMNYRLDALLVYGFLASAAAGLYAIAVTVAEMVLYLPDSASAVLFPSVSGNAEGREQHTTRLTRVMTFLLLVSCLALAVVAFPLITITLGMAFAPSYLAMVLLLPGMIALGISRIIAADIGGRGHPQYGAAAAWIALIATVLLDFLLIPDRLVLAGVAIRCLGWGINGAAVASSVAYTVSAVVLLISYRRVTGTPLRAIIIPRMTELREMVNRLRAALHRMRRSTPHP